MAYIDYYKILGVGKSATADEIKKAYKKLARKYHPDLNPNDASSHKKFQEINEANEVLGDPEKRKKYDRYGENWKHAEESDSRRPYSSSDARFGSAFWSSGQEFGGGGTGEFSDFFEQLFGRGGTRSRSTGFRGADYSAQLHLSLQEAARTHKQVLAVNGKNIRITVPAGVADGQTVKLAGQGAPGANGGPSGDLYITFVIAPDDRFRRLGDDLYVTSDIDLYTAVLGGEIWVDTLDSRVKLKVKPGTQPGAKVRLKSKGFPLYKQEGRFGDLIVTYRVALPDRLTEKQKRLFEELKNS